MRRAQRRGGSELGAGGATWQRTSRHPGIAPSWPPHGKLLPQANRGAPSCNLEAGQTGGQEALQWHAGRLPDQGKHMMTSLSTPAATNTAPAVGRPTGRETARGGQSPLLAAPPPAGSPPPAAPCSGSGSDGGSAAAAGGCSAAGGPLHHVPTICDT